jgi:hypothetical protein
MNGTQPAQKPIPQHLQAGVRDQSTLRWDQFLKGRISKGWTSLQLMDFAVQQLQNTGKSWAAALTLAIWELAWQM